MASYETPSWYNKLSTIVGTFENDPTYIANREAQSFGFCSRCKIPIDESELAEMSEPQRVEYNIIGRCKKCQEEVSGPSCTEVISEFMQELEQEKIDKTQKRKQDIPTINKTPTREKKFDDEKDIIDEDFL